MRNDKNNATQQLIQMHQADYWKCSQQRKCLWNKLIEGEVFWFRGDQYVLEVTSVLLVQQHQSGCFLIRPDEEHLDLYPYRRRGCVHPINLINLLPDSAFRTPLCETAVLGGEAAFSKTKST
jgi:hypothetical protein